MVEFMALTGLLAAEVSGLEVGDITFAPSADPNVVNATVRVRRAKRRRNGECVSGTLKTKNSRRNVLVEPGLAVKLAVYLRDTHERGDDLSAPLWPSRKNGGGYRATGQRYAVPLDYSRPPALGAFDNTIMKPALDAIGLPGSRPARPATESAPARPAIRGVRGTRPPTHGGGAVADRRGRASPGAALRAGSAATRPRDAIGHSRRVRRLDRRR